jgi:hypothetical protein
MLGGCAGDHLAGAVHVPLHDVPAQPAVDCRGALQVHPIADVQVAQGRPVQGLGHHIGLELAVG